MRLYSNSDNWVTVMQEELKAMYAKDVWDLVDLLENFKPIDCEGVFKTKRDSRDNIDVLRPG